MTVVGFAGMTHLGLVSATAVAARGFRTICFDVDHKLIEELRAVRLPVVEPGLDDLLRQNRSQTFTARADDLDVCDIVYIAADVPTDEAAVSDLTPINALIKIVTAAMNPAAVLVVLCQVPPGFSRGLTVIPHERLVYQVETLIFGRAVERALKPERFIVGVADPSRALPPHYETLLKAFDCPILKMRYESAELAKISINFCLVASLSVANVLAEVSEAIGADWFEIAPALRLDRRIGPYAYLDPGLGISGGNLERDLRTVLNLGRQHGTDTRLIDAWMANSAHRKDWPWRVLHEAVLASEPDACIAVLGLAYKENTHSTKNAPALQLLAHLKDRNVKVHDPVVPASVAPGTIGCATALACVRGADAVVIVTPWPEYRALPLETLRELMRGRVLIDPLRVLDGAKARALGFAYHTLGRA